MGLTCFVLDPLELHRAAELRLEPGHLLLHIQNLLSVQSQLFTDHYLGSVVFVFGRQKTNIVVWLSFKTHQKKTKKHTGWFL